MSDPISNTGSSTINQQLQQAAAEQQQVQAQEADSSTETTQPSNEDTVTISPEAVALTSGDENGDKPK